MYFLPGDPQYDIAHLTWNSRKFTQNLTDLSWIICHFGTSGCRDGVSSCVGASGSGLLQWLPSPRVPMPIRLFDKSDPCRALSGKGKGCGLFIAVAGKEYGHQRRFFGIFSPLTRGMAPPAVDLAQKCCRSLVGHSAIFYGFLNEAVCGVSIK